MSASGYIALFRRKSVLPESGAVFHVHPSPMAYRTEPWLNLSKAVPQNVGPHTFSDYFASSSTWLQVKLNQISIPTCSIGAGLSIPPGTISIRTRYRAVLHAREISAPGSSHLENARLRSVPHAAHDEMVRG